MRTSIENAPGGSGIFALCIFEPAEQNRLDEKGLNELALDAQVTGRLACCGGCELSVKVEQIDDSLMNQIEIGCDYSSDKCGTKQAAAVIAAFKVVVDGANERGVEDMPMDGW
jgi:hypothetical protein